jgi:glycosyltransferase involved in cell wall biosynthesis
MRVLLVIYGKLDSRSGGYLYDSMLAKTLRERGHEVEVLSLPSATYFGCLSHNFGREFKDALSAWQGDLIVEDELVHPSLIAANRGLKKSAMGHPPVILLVHHLRASERHPPLLSPLYSLVERAFLRSADAFIYNSQASRASVEALLHSEPPFLTALPGGDRLDAFDRGPRRIGTEPRQGPVRLLFVGNRIPRKNLLVLLEALVHVEGDWRLEVAGDAPGEGARGRDARYARSCAAAATKLPGRVSFLGRISDAELALAYGRSDIFVLPSDHEGFGIVYLEAMRAGLVPVGTDSGGAREAIGDAGALVPPRDRGALAAALGRLVADAGERRRLGAAARERSLRHLGWGESMSALADWLEALPGRESKARPGPGSRR